MDNNQKQAGEFSRTNILKMESNHIEKIVCPECEAVQDAIVEETVPFFTYIHSCVNCDYVITESDWQREKLEEQMIGFHKWMIENDTAENAEKYFHYTDKDMLDEYLKKIK